MANGEGLRKSVLALVVGAAVGFGAGYLVFSQPSETNGTEVPTLEARELVVELIGEGGQLYEHSTIYVDVGRGDQVVWESATLDAFTVTLKCYERVNDQGQGIGPCPDQQLANPFSRHPDPPWQAQSRRVKSGPAIPAARGFKYKFTISANGYKDLDPDIIFR